MGSTFATWKKEGDRFSFPCSCSDPLEHVTYYGFGSLTLPKPRPWLVVPEGLMQGLGEPWRAKPVVSYTFAGDRTKLHGKENYAHESHF